VSRRFTPARLASSGLLLLAVVALLLWLIPSDTYIFLPDRARPVAPIVNVAGGKDPKDGGGIYFVDIFVRKATLLERLWPGLREGAELVPASALLPPGTTEQERRQADRRDMSRSQEVAAAVALREAGYKVIARPNGVLVEQIDPSAPAAKQLQPGDVITSADEARVRVPADLRRAVGKHRPGENVTLVVRRGDGQRRLVVRTKTDPANPSRAIIGVIIDQAAFIKLPIRVRISAGNIGGPSAGLAFALDVLEELGTDVDHGSRIAATGAIALDGTVEPIGGIRQKTIGVRRSGIDVFLVPAGENAAEARKYAEGLRIVPVRTFQQALRTLATLAKKG
jgi:Lon-like protease